LRKDNLFILTLTKLLKIFNISRQRDKMEIKLVTGKNISNFLNIEYYRNI